ncbi:MAG TPA: NUDIX domain-containing protein [Nitrospirae bacterium]|nr:NUDIX domain-containing protein [Nitrospirota bacterium]
MQEELLEVVSETGEVIRTLPRSEIHGNPSLIHRVVHVLVFNEKGELFLQKRSMNKDVAAGKWDTSVGGHVNSGETPGEAVKREMEEELGITTCDPEFLYTYIHSNPYETELVHTYYCTYDGEINFQEDEIDEVRPWSLDEIRLNTGSGILSDNFEHEIEKYMKYVTIHTGTKAQSIKGTK